MRFIQTRAAPGGGGGAGAGAELAAHFRKAAGAGEAGQYLGSRDAVAGLFAYALYGVLHFRIVLHSRTTASYIGFVKVSYVFFGKVFHNWRKICDNGPM